MDQAKKVKDGTISRTLLAAALAAAAVLIIIGVLSKAGKDPATSKKDHDSPAKITAEIAPPEPESRMIDFENPEDTVKDRKSRYGIRDSVDIIAKEGETLKVGTHIVSMAEIRDKTNLARGQIVEKEISDTGAEKNLNTKEYGIHVVVPGDNIWNIHFRFLMDYFESRQEKLSPLSDEPSPSGNSSGVGKLLKFSENMVVIYNLEEKRVDSNINLIQPLSKIVVYNMNEIFSFLDSMDPGSIGRIRFNGESIWIQAEQ